MKTLSAGLLAHLASETTTTCTLWHLVRPDGVAMGFTDHDADVVYDGTTYSAATGYTRTALSSDGTLSVDNMDLEGLLSSAGLTADDIRGGLYDWSVLTVLLVNYQDLTQGSVILRKGYLGEFTVKSGAFVTELRGLSQNLSRNFIKTYTADCTADLGDDRCKVKSTLYRETGTVTGITTQRRVFTVKLTGARAAGFFDGGLLTWTGGANLGAKAEVRTVTSGTMTLYLPAAEDLTIGDAFSLSAGCDKSTTMCKNRFDNILNNRSFPFIPGSDAVNRLPDAKQT